MFLNKIRFGNLLNLIEVIWKDKIFTDKFYLSIKYKQLMGKRIDWKKLTGFNEKLQWLKLYNRKKEYSKFVDKYAVREYIEKRIGAEYLIPLLGVWDNPDDIDFDKLPNQFVLKCNHNSGLGMCICKDKSLLDIEKTRKELRNGLAQDYYMTLREWPYKNVPRKIIAEKYLVDDSSFNEGLTDYKFSCFNGYVSDVMLCLDRHLGEPKFYFFDKDWNLLRINKRGKEAPADFTLPKPPNMDKMFEIASFLSKGIPYVRVDLYNCNGHIYFGEMTFYPCSGFDNNLLLEADARWSNLINLDMVKKG